MADAADGGDEAAFDPKQQPRYKKETDVLASFLRDFHEPLAKGGAAAEAKYAALVRRVARRELRSVEIALDDLQAWNPAIVRAVTGNAKRYVELFAEAVRSLLPPVAVDGALAFSNGEDRAEIFHGHRISELRRNMYDRLVMENKAAGDADVDAAVQAEIAKWPVKLMRRFDVRFSPRTDDGEKPRAVRELKAGLIGHLVTVKALVARASDVKPRVVVASYTCASCSSETFQEIVGKSFMPPAFCDSHECRTNRTFGRLRPQLRGSVFQKYQELRVQETPEQVPVGSIPRTLLIVATGDTARACVPGEEVLVTGIFLASPGENNSRRRGVSASGLVAETYLEAQHVIKLKKATTDAVPADLEEAIAATADADPYTRLAASIAPEIFGLDDVKKALLLQLVGGVTQTQADGMRTRGDINICLMGDPGVAKSQLLKHVSKLVNRGVYTTGKGSSGVGLTASIAPDPTTGELALEGGALVIADMGICCIDEFDKMDDSDRTAIHEVMEQQTVSIAKAGITTTLNARTAILAAANPRYGRYNRRADADAHVALQKNVNLPAALLSRFDLLFLLLDEVDEANDKALAAHVTHVHQNDAHPPLASEPLPPAFIRQYIAVAKHIVPLVPSSLQSYVVEAYVDMRARDKARAAATGSRGTLTARQLLSILRMSQALARLELRLEVQQRDIDEAIRLVNISKASVLDSDAGERRVDGDYVSRIWAAIRDKAVAAKSTFMTMADARAVATAVGFSDTQLAEMLTEYESLGLLAVNAARTGFEFVTLG